MDKYAIAEQFLLAVHDEEFELEVHRAWNAPYTHEAGCLFTYVTPTGNAWDKVANRSCGCLTQIRSGRDVACTKELTQLIFADKTLPAKPMGITRDNLHRFAEWQRKLDAMFPGRNGETITK